MNWIEVKINTTSEASDAVSQMLMSIGSGGVVIEDPFDIKKEAKKAGSLDYIDENLLNTADDNVVVKAYFSADRNRSELVHIISEKINFISKFLNTGKGNVAISEVNDEDWANNWKKHYKPFHISERVVIKPSWESYNAKRDEVVIEIDPGMAFGTGTHDTTKMCAVFIEKYLNKNDLVLDIGCGTGILSIISAKLGAKKVKAIDIESTAVKVAKENCILNNVNHIVDIYQGTLADFDFSKSNIIVANIIADVIIDISEIVPNYIKEGGFFIASGIIKEREKEVVNKYLGLGYSVNAKIESGEWVAIAFRCQDSL